MDSITEANISRLNRLFISELGENPPIAWRWSEDLTYLQSKFDSDGKPVYESKIHNFLIVQVQAKELAKMFPDLVNQWVACQLTVFPDSETGAVHGTGNFAWVPIGAGIEPLALDPGEVPTREVTMAITQRIRHARATQREREQAFEEQHRASVPLDESINHPKFSRLVTPEEKKNYDNHLAMVKNEHSAFLTVPGEKAHVSFPPVQEKS